MNFIFYELSVFNDHELRRLIVLICLFLAVALHHLLQFIQLNIHDRGSRLLITVSISHQIIHIERKKLIVAYWH